MSRYTLQSEHLARAIGRRWRRRKEEIRHRRIAPADLVHGDTSRLTWHRVCFDYLAAAARHRRTGNYKVARHYCGLARMAIDRSYRTPSSQEN